jgi:DNA-binding NtrC family response regulator
MAPPGQKEGDLVTQTFAMPELPHDARRAASWVLRVIGDGVFGTHPLPPSGDVVIGRAEQADIRIDHPSISRRHALLSIGPPLVVSDLGSVNGTRVGEAMLGPSERRTINQGEIIEVGSVMVVVQRGLESARPRRVWTHSAFEARLEGECARAERSGSAFAVARVLAENKTQAAQIEEGVIDTLRSADMVACYAVGEYELLLVDLAPDAAEQAVRNLSLKLAARGIPVRSGLAGFPQDGRTAEELISRASRGVRGGGSSEVIVVQDGAMQRLHRLVERVAAGNISVLLLGETGVGKEVFAETVHRLSPRAKGPFLRLNCVAFSESLLESELFGHERGAFTGAVNAKQGQLETADGGTVFLDEVGELPLSIQVKLLRVLEERRVTRVGALKSREIDVRFIAATNRQLEAEISAGRFRQDLFFRLNGFSLTIPPLRERVAEIEPLARAFLIQACREARRQHHPEFSAEAIQLLRSYSWPGNVRELRNVIERAVLLAPGDTITAEHLPVDKMHASMPSYMELPALADMLEPENPEPREREATPMAVPAQMLPPQPTRLRSDLQQVEKQRILDALAACAGNQSQAAKMLGMPRNTLLARLDAYGVPRPRKKSPTE